MSSSFGWLRPRIVWGVLSALAPATAGAEPPQCSPSVVADDGVAAAWPELPARVRRALSERESVDPCARVSLVENEGIRVDVTLPDGRTASRTVAREDDVLVTLEALLVVPELARRPEADAAPSSEAPATSVLSGSSESDEPAPLQPARLDEAPPASPAPAPAPAPDRASEPMRDRLGIEVGAVTSARIGGDDFTSFSLGLLALLQASGWLVGFQGRAAEYAWSPSPEHGDTWGTLEVGLLFGHRFDFDSIALDLVSGPALAIEAGNTTVTGPADGEGMERESSPTTMTVPRWLAASHLVWPTRSTVRGFVGVEGELGPRGDGVTLDGPRRLPPWMVGLALGAVIGGP